MGIETKVMIIVEAGHGDQLDGQKVKTGRDKKLAKREEVMSIQEHKNLIIEPGQHCQQCTRYERDAKTTCNMPLVVCSHTWHPLPPHSIHHLHQSMIQGTHATASEDPDPRRHVEVEGNPCWVEWYAGRSESLVSRSGEALPEDDQQVSDRMEHGWPHRCDRDM